MNTPLVSVIIPTYNHEKYIKETIISIINQTYENIELIIIDDGSTDSTWQKIQNLKTECEKRFVSVIFEKKENEGIPKTLNKLVSKSNGKYIFIIASDDVAKPRVIEKEVDFLEKNTDYELVVGNNEFIDKSGKQINFKTKNKEYKTFADFLKRNHKKDFTENRFGTYETLYNGNYIPNGYLIRSSIFDKIGNYTEEAPLEDYWLMLQISKYGKMKYIDEILYSYRKHENNIINNKKYISDAEEKTRQYEEKILEKIDEKTILENVLKVKNNGVCYKTKGIPFIFEIQVLRRKGKKIKVLKIFNIKLLEF